MVIGKLTLKEKTPNRSTGWKMRIHGTGNVCKLQLLEVPHLALKLSQENNCLDA